MRPSLRGASNALPGVEGGTHPKLRRFQEIIHGEVGTIPLLTEFDNVVMRANVQGYVSYPDGSAFLPKLYLA